MFHSSALVLDPSLSGPVQTRRVEFGQKHLCSFENILLRSGLDRTPKGLESINLFKLPPEPRSTAVGHFSQLPAPSSQLPAPSSQLPAPSSQLPAPSSQLPAHFTNTISEQLEVTAEHFLLLPLCIELITEQSSFRYVIVYYWIVIPVVVWAGCYGDGHVIGCWVV